MRLFRASQHGCAFREAGFEDDLAICGAVDVYGALPVHRERQIATIGPERGRQRVG